jgi:hypothetical protein
MQFLNEFFGWKFKLEVFTSRKWANRIIKYPTIDAFLTKVVFANIAS